MLMTAKESSGFRSRDFLKDCDRLLEPPGLEVDVAEREVGVGDGRVLGDDGPDRLDGLFGVARRCPISRALDSSLKTPILSRGLASFWPLSFEESVNEPM